MNSLTARYLSLLDVCRFPEKTLHSDLESPSLVRHHPNPHHHEEVAAGSLAAGWDPGAHAGHHPSATARSDALPVSCATSESQPIAARHAPISHYCCGCCGWMLAFGCCTCLLGCWMFFGCPMLFSFRLFWPFSVFWFACCCLDSTSIGATKTVIAAIVPQNKRVFKQPNHDCILDSKELFIKTTTSTNDWWTTKNHGERLLEILTLAHILLESPNIKLK